MNFLITGGTGFLGRNLVESLSLNPKNKIFILSRSKEDKLGQINFVKWNGKKIPKTLPPQEIIINMAGASLAEGKWTEDRKKILLQSRIDSTKACVDYIKQAAKKPKLFISSSAVGFYDGYSDTLQDENSIPGTDFMAKICKEWERAALGSGIRTVILRTSVILDSKEGPLAEIAKPFKFFLGGPIGSGKQHFPWMHIKDWVSAVLFIIDKPEIEGPVNMVHPEIHTNNSFSKVLSTTLKKPNLFRVPSFLIKLILGEKSAIILQGPRLKPEVLLKNNYSFVFDSLDEALNNLFSK